MEFVRDMIMRSAFPFDAALDVRGACFVDLDVNGSDEAQEGSVVAEGPKFDRWQLAPKLALPVNSSIVSIPA